MSPVSSLNRSGVHAGSLTCLQDCRFSKPEETEKAKAVFNGRQFDGNVVVAKEAPEEEFDRANAGQWTGGIDPPVAMYAPVMTG